jgi:hypothetical protein
VIWRAIKVMDPAFNWKPTRHDLDGLSGTKSGTAYWTDPVAWMQAAFDRLPEPGNDRIVGSPRSMLVAGGFSVEDTGTARDPHHVSIGGITPGIEATSRGLDWRGTQADAKATRRLLESLFTISVWP